MNARLASAGRGGLLAYGVLNALYYCSVTTVAYGYFFNSDVLSLSVPSTASGTVRIAAAAKAMGKVVGIVWAGEI